MKKLMKNNFQKYAKGVTLEIEDLSSLASFIMDLLNMEDVDTEECDLEEFDILDVEASVHSDLDLISNKAFKILWEMLKKIPELTLVTEEYYVDKVYRDSYYTYYSCKHFEYSRYCKRLFIFNGKLETTYKTAIIDLDSSILQKEFIGCVVVRPLSTGPIGRSLLNPFYLADGRNTYIRHAEYNVTMFGKRLTVRAFPFSMQDEETTTCAEITIINLLDYFSRKYAEYKFLVPSEIINIAIKNGYERRLPTKGLDYLVISKILMEAGFFPVLYNYDEIEDLTKFKRILHYYIESGIPVAIGLEINKNMKHSIICIGHGEVNQTKIGNRRYSINDALNKNRNLWLIDSSDLVCDYIVMDDNQKPYSKYTWEVKSINDSKPNDNVFFTDKEQTFGGWKPDYLLVPLYKRMFLEAADAYDICTSVLADGEMGIKSKELGTMDNPVIIRLFMASARGFKNSRINNYTDRNKEIRERYINTPFPRFIWVCELYEMPDYPNYCCGEIIVDATAAPNAKLESIILIQYPNLVYERLPDSKMKSSATVFKKLITWEKFKGYRGNLHRPERSS